MKNKEKEGLFIGLNINKNIPVTFESFESYKPNENYNTVIFAKAGQGMCFKNKNEIISTKNMEK